MLAPNIGQCSAKNRVMTDEGWFTADTVLRREKKVTDVSELRSIRLGLYCSGFFMNILIDNLLMEFFHIPNRTMCLSKKTPLNTFYMSLHNIDKNHP